MKFHGVCCGTGINTMTIWQDMLFFYQKPKPSTFHQAWLAIVLSVSPGTWKVGGFLFPGGVV